MAEEKKEKKVDPAAAKKAAIKEGGKKGQDLAGMADMGGVNFFHVAIEAANGDWELLQDAMHAANKEVDEAAEDRKGGGGMYGKIFFSAGDEELIMLGHVPDALKDKIDLTEWMQAICDSGIKGKIVGSVENNMLKASAAADRNNNLFPLKMRDTAIGAGFSYLRKKGLVVDADSDDDVDYAGMAEAGGIEW